MLNTKDLSLYRGMAGSCELEMDMRHRFGHPAVGAVGEPGSWWSKSPGFTASPCPRASARGISGVIAIGAQRSVGPGSTVPGWICQVPDRRHFLVKVTGEILLPPGARPNHRRAAIPRNLSVPDRLRLGAAPRCPVPGDVCRASSVRPPTAGRSTTPIPRDG